jgi:purine-binding chemotaxis protein CheW
MKRLRDEHQAFDWQRVHERVARAIAATEEGVRLSPEQARTLLDERARLLARVPPARPDAASLLEVVTFRVAGERYAIGSRHVREVVRRIELTPLPGAPDSLAGVVNLRGEILAVFDPRTFFGLGERGPAASCMLVLGGDRIEFGLLADEVEDVRTLRMEEILPPSATLADPGREYLRGVTADALLVLDGAILLHDRRLFLDIGEAAGSAVAGENP